MKTPGLFDAVASSPPRLYVLTNRFNLLAILGSRLIGPRSLYSKYYPDLLEWCPGRIVMLASGVGPDLISPVATSDASFPVLLELDPARLRLDGAAALGPEGLSQVESGRDVVAWAAAAVLPLSVADRIHFRSTEELREHQLREYENIDSTTLALDVSPGLFAETHVSADALRGWLSSLPELAGPTAEAVASEDRASGGSVLALGLAQSEKLPFEVIAALGTRRVDEAIQAIAAPRASVAATGDAVAAFDHLRNRSDWRPIDLAERLADGARERGEDDLAEDYEAAVAILRNEAEVAAWGTHRSPVATAVLMALMRPEPDDLLGWLSGRPGGLAESLIALALVGSMVGRRRLAARFRPPALDNAMAASEAVALSTQPLLVDAGTLSAVRRPEGLTEVLLDGHTVGEYKTAGGDEALRAALTAEGADGAAVLRRLGSRAKELQRYRLTKIIASEPAATVEMTVRDGRTAITVAGPVEIEESLDLSALERALTAGELSQAQAQALEVAVSQPPPRPRRRSSKGTQTG